MESVMRHEARQVPSWLIFDVRQKGRDVTADEFRTLALGIADTVESAHMDHPDFRIAGRIFASLGAPDASWGMVKLTPEDQRSFIKKAPGVFKSCNGAWGRSGCTNVHLASAKRSVLHPAIEAASKNVASHAKKKKPA